MASPITSAPFLNISANKSTATKTSSPENKADQSFRSVLAQQKSDAEKQKAATAPTTVSEPVAPPTSPAVQKSTSSDGKDNTTATTKDTPPDPASNLIALLQPLQELRKAPKPDLADTAGDAKMSSLTSKLKSQLGQTDSLRAALANAPAASIASDALPISADPLLNAKSPAAFTQLIGAEGNLELAVTNVAPRAEDLMKFSLPNTLSNPLGNTSKLPDTPAQAIAAPFGSAAWNSEFTQKISWMTHSKLDQVAELHLNPPNLGPLDVVLKISDNQATAMFSSPHLAVREAVESAMPKLRELLADNGITLGNTSVSDQAPRDNNNSANTNEQGASNRWSNQGNNVSASDETPLTMTAQTTIQRHNGMVDTFA